MLVYPWLREGDTGSDKEAAQAGDSSPDLAQRRREKWVVFPSFNIDI